MTDTRKQLITRLQRATYAYTEEYLAELDNKAKEDKALEAFDELTKESEKTFCMCLTADHNIEVMLECIREMKRAIDVLYNEENEDIEEWMIAGVNAMLDKANEMKIIPYDLPTAICGVLGTQWRK